MEVRREVSILFGEDEEAGQEMVVEIREKIVRAAQDAYRRLEKLERDLYGEVSYYYIRENGLEVVTDGEGIEDESVSLEDS